jgi:hypothetical protein
MFIDHTGLECLVLGLLDRIERLLLHFKEVFLTTFHTSPVLLLIMPFFSYFLCQVFNLNRHLMYLLFLSLKLEFVLLDLQHF